MKTCGELYKEFSTWAIARYGGVMLFASGSMAGQAEKVYLGACPACMFRPSQEYWTLVDEVCAKICQVYNLRYRFIRYHDIGEFWIYNPTKTTASLLEVFADSELENTDYWHSTRAYLCGIPVEKIDYNYHEREAYAQSCEAIIHTK